MLDARSSSLARLLGQFADPGWAAALTDGELLERFRAHRDERAFAALVRRHGAAVVSVCRCILHHAEDIEDAFQATFLVLVRSSGSIRKRQSVGSWLQGVAHRVAVRAKADRARRRALEGRAPLRTAPDLLPEVERRDLRSVLDEEVRQLPERCRLPFVLCHLEGKTNEEAAHLLGCPKGTVLSRLAHARKLLRGRLARRGLGLGTGLAATVPASLVGATARAARFVAGEGTAARGVSAPVRALTERVVKAMWLTKLRLAAALVLTVALVGGGASLLAYRARGADRQEPPVAGEDVVAAAGAEPPPAADRGRPREDGRDRPSAEPVLSLDQARKAVQDLEQDVRKREELWTKEFVQAEIQVLPAEEDLRQLERRFTLERERERADIKQVEQELRRQKTPFADKKDKEIAAVLDDQLQMLDDRWKERERMRSAATVTARRELALAESQLRLLERQQEGQRARAQELLHAADDRVRATEEQLRRRELGQPPVRDSGREAELERKLDRVLQELTEVRRALRRPPPDPDRSKPDRRPPDEP